MVSRTYVIRNIEPADREKNALRIARAEQRGDVEEAARPHARRDEEEPSWDKVRQIRKDIQTLEAELDRLLQVLEP